MIAAAYHRLCSLLAAPIGVVMFWLGVLRDTGLHGARLSLRIHRASKAIAAT